jgi:tRNA(fMet)-specific endonuclease VapC
MSLVYLLDTSVVVELFRNNVPIVAKLTGKAVVLCSPVMGELYFGALKSADTVSQRRKLDSFAGAMTVYATDKRTSEHYASIKMALQLKGKPIPENDIWIAAVAIEHDLIVATRDAHFREVDSLKPEMW